MGVKTIEEEKLHFIDPSWQSDLSGAYRAMTSIKDAQSLLHTPSGCQLYVFALQSLQDFYYGMTGTTALAERDVVFGGEEKLREALVKSIEVYDPKMIGIIGSTASRLIGDDIKGIITLVQREAGANIPIFSVDTSSVEGDHISGYNMVLNALVETVMKEPEKKLENTVNIFGIQEDAPNGRADFLEISHLLHALGIEVHVPFLCENTTQQIREAPQASLNVVLADNLGLPAARLMEKKFDVPYVTLDYPIGLTNTTNLLKEVAAFFKVQEETVDKLIQEETQQEYRVLAAGNFFLEDIPGVRAAIISDSMMALAFTRFLKEDLDIEPALVCMITRGDDSISRLEALENELGFDTMLLAKPNYIHIRKALEELKPNLVLGGCLEKFTMEQVGLLEQGSTFISIPTFPSAWGVHVFPRPFVGYKGFVNFLETLFNELLKFGFPPQSSFREMKFVEGY
jgi:nitrogenase molybdenum-iron protein beta chain